MSTSDKPTTMAATIDLPKSKSGPTGIFDNLEELKLSLEGAGLAGSTEVLMRVPVRKPTRQEYFRVRAGVENCFTAIIYEDQGLQMREYYFVTPAMIPALRAITTLWRLPNWRSQSGCVCKPTWPSPGTGSLRLRATSATRNGLKRHSTSFSTLHLRTA
jgi:hypothetical protein